MGKYLQAVPSAAQKRINMSDWSTDGESGSQPLKGTPLIGNDVMQEPEEASLLTNFSVQYLFMHHELGTEHV